MDPQLPRRASRLVAVQKRRKFRLADWLTVAVSVLVLVGLFWLFVGAGSHVENGAPPTDPGHAWNQLTQLRVVGDGPSEDAPTYSRDHFGPGWGDLDGDGCNTRNEILARDLGQATYEDVDCVVDTGVLAEPYTGEIMRFQKGPETSMEVQIDHVVALGDAWEAGAWQWDDSTRQQFSNDPLNLLAVDGHQNYLKGALTADQWLPPDDSFHCQFISRQVSVKYKWDLTVTQSEAAVMRQILAECPETQVE